MNSCNECSLPNLQNETCNGCILPNSFHDVCHNFVVPNSLRSVCLTQPDIMREILSGFSPRELGRLLSVCWAFYEVILGAMRLTQSSEFIDSNYGSILV